MGIEGRIGRAERLVRGLDSAKDRRGRMVDLTGATVDEVLEAILRATPKADHHLLDTIAGQVEEHRVGTRVPWYCGKPEGDQVHGFVEWIAGLREGWARLPRRIPRVVLEDWSLGYTHHPTHGTPVPHTRCDSCWMVLPFVRLPCPVCGSLRLCAQNLARPEGVFREYDPVHLAGWHVPNW